jgi:hypothetical protein
VLAKIDHAGTGKTSCAQTKSIGSRRRTGLEYESERDAAERCSCLAVMAMEDLFSIDPGEKAMNPYEGYYTT